MPNDDVHAKQRFLMPNHFYKRQISGIWQKWQLATRTIVDGGSASKHDCSFAGPRHYFFSHRWNDPGLRSRKFLGGFGFLTTLGVGVGFCSPTVEVQLNHFLHHTPMLGIRIEMVQFLLKLLLKQNSFGVAGFPLIANCYEIVDSQTSFTSC